MSNPTIGIIGGGQLGSMLSAAAKNLNIKTVIISATKKIHKPKPAIAMYFSIAIVNYSLFQVINHM